MPKIFVDRETWETDIPQKDLKGFEGLVLGGSKTLISDIEKLLKESYSFKTNGHATFIAGMMVQKYTKTSNTLDRISKLEQRLKKTESDLSDTKLDLSKTKSDLSKTKSDLSDTQSALSNTKIDLSSTKDELYLLKMFSGINEFDADVSTTVSIKNKVEEIRGYEVATYYGWKVTKDDVLNANYCMVNHAHLVKYRKLHHICRESQLNPQSLLKVTHLSPRKILLKHPQCAKKYHECPIGKSRQFKRKFDRDDLSNCILVCGIVADLFDCHLVEILPKNPINGKLPLVIVKAARQQTINPKKKAKVADPEKFIGCELGWPDKEKIPYVRALCYHYMSTVNGNLNQKLDAIKTYIELSMTQSLKDSNDVSDDDEDNDDEQNDSIQITCNLCGQRYDQGNNHACLH